jgi:surfactin synthase thioesterase subunit
LLLLPHSGGLAQGYADWARWFPTTVRLVAAQYPGRGPRYGEEPARDLTALADPLAEVVADLEGPVHVFGHSLGALLGFEICWRLHRAGRPATAFFPSSAAGAHIHPPGHTDREPADEPSDDELIAVLRERGGMPQEVLDNPDLLELVTESCRVDMEISRQYRYGAQRRVLDCPLVAFGGGADTAVPADTLDRWRDLTTGPAEVHVFPGGHFYLHRHMAAVTATIRRRLPAAPTVSADSRRFP